jgi:glucose-1-phosphate cytidylyltransferase
MLPDHGGTASREDLFLMKVVLFCGGLGLRLREYSDVIPKPMIPIGVRPILWHVMRYYAHYGHKEFILCLGYKADVIKDYFVRYSEAASNDFVLSDGGRSLELLSTDIEDWKITFVDTGMRASVGERLRAVRKHIGDDEVFLANYADTLTDAPLDTYIERFVATDKVAAFLAVRPRYTFHVVKLTDGDRVTDITHIRESDTRINGGNFILRREIFDYLLPGEELVNEPFHRLIEKGALIGYPYDGFWAPMDTLQDKQDLEKLSEDGDPPWTVWRSVDQASR